MTRLKKTIFKFYGALVLGLILISFFLFTELLPQNLKFYVFNVGQGDAIFIRTPGRYNILIDGGPDNTVIYKLGKYLPFYDRQIDLLILTHPHADHIIGLIEVLKRYQVKRILATEAKDNSPEYAAWQKEIAKRKIPVEIADHPGFLNLTDGTKLEILWPKQSFLNQKVNDLNNTSIVTKFFYASSSILLMGDFDKEEELLDQQWDLTAEILKVGHHGSITANDLKFLQAIKPRQAVISCGVDNKYGHPSPKTLENLKQIGAQIWRTDQQGDFYFASP